MQFIDLLLVRCIFGGQIGHNNYEDFEHPTCRGNCKNQWNFRVALTGRIARKCFIPRALPWAVEILPLQGVLLQYYTQQTHLNPCYSLAKPKRSSVKSLYYQNVVLTIP